MTTQCCRSRLFHILLATETDFAELLMGLISVVIGVWLITPAAHIGFSTFYVVHMLPEVWGTLLLTAGLLKLGGVYNSKLPLRKLSCLIATWVWGFVAFSFYQAGLANLTGLPLAILMLVFNGIIYIKLEVVLSRRRRNL